MYGSNAGSIPALGSKRLMMVLFLLVMFFAHFAGDFVLQTDWQAKNKWTNGYALLGHTVTYSVCFLGFGPWFALVTFVTHTAVDALTSQYTHHFATAKAAPDWHKFFVVVGFDQFLHAVQLVLTAHYLLKVL